jgi:hypothetical protein
LRHYSFVHLFDQSQRLSSVITPPSGIGSCEQAKFDYQDHVDDGSDIFWWW